MSVSVTQEHVTAFLEKAQERGVESSLLGEFTDSGLFEVFYLGKPLVVLDLEFLHKGVPRKRMAAQWPKRPEFSARIPEYSLEKTTRLVVSSMDVCSKEWIFRQYDHNVKG